MRTEDTQNYCSTRWDEDEGGTEIGEKRQGQDRGRAAT